MKEITLGTTGITVPQNAFGALPIQRVDMETAVKILRRAYEGGMTFFDTARAYSDSEEKMGDAFAGIRGKIYIASKTMAHTPEEFVKQLDQSLELLQTDYIDIYQFHCVDVCYRPGDGTGMYECMLKAKEQGKIRHIGVTSHKMDVARECIESGLYETLQYPFSYLSSEKELELVEMCRERNMGFIAMKGLAGGLLNNSRAASAFMSGFDNVLPIWGVQRMEELEEWLAYMEDAPVLDEEMSAFIEKEKKELTGNFCRGCGYCMPCPAGIVINNCARMSLMVRRAPSSGWLSEEWQEKMKKIEGCLQCGQCRKKCPYELDTPNLLKRNYEDYKKILAGEVTV
ncbi:aldo/keto reductase [Clostridium sp. D5]|uniref:aldo/keto reductase n=1 Tax=Clostridium sp. D5 TaxID=556261 RepID=UPI0001FC7AE8|nr:aldo/keto reductase [Clostridium sp. D5]EGB93062.1 oxidoreductase, aldo/keto reductase family [Clostridium sp. D5]